ncbi:Piso0_002849 [Millerozyma farinosa CBS 7064]|uniref:Piso0_002849 protein n=1 Tax=Pichia sorbitophila (strain ATCC MYA-4447 / BCRC 22081 / CBS 7064 / NBRC 10061 / NRRL Y-12695) TaxID=559304 RepID=G8YDP2_PICSO|nr:Piso0_002849 [Millerozyma farinosa CBS 7064]
MGLLSIIRKHKLKDNELRVLVLGLDNAGKSTITKKLKNEDVNSVAPTLGFQINTVQFKEFNLNLWDIGGQASIRSFWGNYYDQTDVVIWVVDALSTERLSEVYEELRDKVLLQDRLKGVYLAILINKIDLIPSEYQDKVKEKVEQQLDLDSQVKDKSKFASFLVSGKSGHNLEEALNWIISREY